MDHSDPQITFDNDGICNHCLRFDDLLEKRTHVGDVSQSTLKKLINKIKTSRGRKEYDCIIGISGGIDSTHVAYIVKKYGLNPLAVHFDNGWNSELAISNIEKVLDILDIDLHTHVINWEAFKNCQIAFLKSSTPDGEIPTDHAINAVLFQTALKYKVKYIITGMNFATEGMAVPSWSYGHSDWRYIKNIFQTFGVKKKHIAEYPHFGLIKLGYYILIRRIKVVSILNYINYERSEAVKIITKELGWVEYPQKHYESTYTRFFQGYYLVEKFSIDKRRGHLSDLIRSNQISRDDALLFIKKPPYKYKRDKQKDIEFVRKKIGLSEKEFKTIINSQNKNHSEYKNMEKYIIKLKSLYNVLRLKGIVSK